MPLPSTPDSDLIKRTDCDHLNKRCGVGKCLRRAIYWFVKPSNGGRNIYVCPNHVEDAKLFVSSPWPEKAKPEA